MQLIVNFTQTFVRHQATVLNFLANYLITSSGAILRLQIKKYTQRLVERKYTTRNSCNSWLLQLLRTPFPGP